MLPKPMITIIIPTRNRCDTLAGTLKTCVEQNHDSLSIVVSDNCSDDNTRDVVHSFHDERIRYLRTPNRLSMTGNFEFSLGKAPAGYVGFIGDDDGLMPRAIETVARMIEETSTDAIVSSSVFYGWPNYPLEDWRNMALVRDLGTAVISKTAAEEVARLVSFTGLEHRYVWGLPSVYRGFINSKVIERARVNGRYFNSVTPDAYSAFVNSFFLERYLYLETPLTIEGVSGKSNGASQIYGKDSKEEAQYLKENDIPFHDALVYAPSPPIILAEAYLQARELFPEHCAGHDFNIARVCAAALKYLHPGPNHLRVTEAVAEIRRKHSSHASTSSQRFHRRIVERLSHVKDLLHSMEVDCNKFHAHDVYEASVVVSNLLSLHQNGGTISGIQLAGKKIMSRLTRS
jgi:glycosyltransferase involved in cell wall biosynthesis